MGFVCGCPDLIRLLFIAATRLGWPVPRARNERGEREREVECSRQLMGGSNRAGRRLFLVCHHLSALFALQKPLEGSQDTFVTINKHRFPLLLDVELSSLDTFIELSVVVCFKRPGTLRTCVWEIWPLLPGMPHPQRCQHSCSPTALPAPAWWPRRELVFKPPIACSL